MPRAFLGCNKLPHYMEGTKVSRIRESHNRQKYKRATISLSGESRNNENQTIKNSGVKTLPSKKEETFSDELKHLPGVEEYMQEVEAILKNRNSHVMFCRLEKISMNRTDRKFLKCSCIINNEDDDDASGTTKKDATISFNRKTANSTEFQLPVISNSSSVIRETSSRKEQVRYYSPSSTNSRHIFHQNQGFSSPPESKTSSLTSAPCANRLSTRRHEDSKVSSSLGDLLKIHLSSSASVKFPAIRKVTTESKLPCLIKDRDVLCKPPHSRVQESAEIWKGSVHLRCPSQTDDRPYHKNSEQKSKHSHGKENLKGRHGTRGGGGNGEEEERQVLDESEVEMHVGGVEEADVGWRRGKQKERYFYEHTFSSLQKTTTPTCRAKTFPTKRLFNSDKKKKKKKKSPHVTETLNLRTPARNRQSIFRAIANEQLQNNNADDDDGDDTNKQTNRDEESWKRERISAWVSRVNELASHLGPTFDPSLHHQDHQQTALLVVHEDDEDSWKFLF